MYMYNEASLYISFTCPTCTCTCVLMWVQKHNSYVRVWVLGTQFSCDLGYCRHSCCVTSYIYERWLVRDYKVGGWVYNSILLLSPFLRLSLLSLFPFLSLMLVCYTHISHVQNTLCMHACGNVHGCKAHSSTCSVTKQQSVLDLKFICAIPLA